VPWMRYNRLQGENWIVKLTGERIGLPLAQWEPAFHATPIQFKSYVLSAFWVVVCISLTAWFLSGKINPSKDSKK